MAELKVYRGVAVSGLEFAGSFEANSADTYHYIAEKGFDLVRISTDWWKLQPELFGEFDTTELGFLLENIAWAKSEGLDIIIDIHNYARRAVYKNGGITEDFTSNPLRNFKYPWADYDADGHIVLRNYGECYFGTFQNPLVGNAYKVSYNMKFNSRDDFFGGEGLRVRPMYLNENNYYEFFASLADNNWTLRKKVAGVTTTLATGSKIWGTSSTYAIDIDINQATNGKINITVDGTPLYTADSVNSDAGLVKGKVQFMAQGTHTRLDGDLVLNIAGDVSDGGVTSDQIITSADLPIEAWEDFLTRLSDEFKDESAVIGYDHNESHDLPVPTNSANYSQDVADDNSVPVATNTRIVQAMVDAVRANGDDKYIIAEMDFWANTHRFNEQYGTNPDPWIIDPLNKVVYSGHYYLDSDHSGSYSDPTIRTEESIEEEITPFLAWAQAKGVIAFIGEVGVPEDSDWYPGLEKVYDLADEYNAWVSYWAMGDNYTSPTGVQPTGGFTIDKGQMPTILAHLGYTATLPDPEPEPEPEPEPPIIPTAPVVPIRHQIIVKDKAGNEIGQISDWFNLVFSDQLNNYGQATFDIPIDSDDANKLISLRRYEIDIYENGVIVWSGEQANADVILAANTPNLVTITCYTYPEMLNARFTPKEKLRIEDTDQALILKQLVDESQARTDGNFGFTFAPIVPTMSRDREYELDNIMESFINMSNVINGIDFWIDHNKVIHFGEPRRGVNKSNQFGLEWGINIKEMKITDNFASPANTAYAIGAGDGITQLIASFADPLARNTYKLREQTTSAIDVSELDTLTGKAEDLVESNKNQRRTVTVIQMPNTNPSLDKVFLGDYINVKIKKGRYDINTPFRVIGYECSVGEVGEANISWVLENTI